MKYDRDLIQSRVTDGQCPICGKVITAVDENNKVRGYKIVEDKNIFFKGEIVKVCDTHIVEN